MRLAQAVLDSASSVNALIEALNDDFGDELLFRGEAIHTDCASCQVEGSKGPRCQSISGKQDLFVEVRTRLYIARFALGQDC